jgi:hypothetical protein
MFPGKNTIVLSKATIGQIVLKQLQALSQDIRVQSINVTYTGYEVEFTTDPKETAKEDECLE